MQLSLILALLVLLLTTVGVVLMNLEAARKRRGLIAACGVVGVLLAVASVFATPRDGVDEWGRRVNASVERCRETDTAVCLATALERYPPPRTEESGVSSVFFSDMRLAHALLAGERTRNLLWDEFGIDSDEFLGTGFSAPHTEAGPARSYAEARQREFFASNLCADVIDNNRCPAEAANVWTWRLHAGDARQWLDRPVKDVLGHVRPSDHLEQWRRGQRTFLSGADSESRQVLVRFARFNPQYYSGTVGRPDANLVFFTSLSDVRSITLSEAMARTGSEALAEQPPDEDLFIWVYAPDEGQEAPPATWAALFAYLERLASVEQASEPVRQAKN